MAERPDFGSREAEQAFKDVTAAMEPLTDEGARADVLGAYALAQSPATQNKVVEVIQQGPFPGTDQRTVNRLWFAVIIGLLDIGVLGAVLGFVLLMASKDASAAWAFAAAGVGGLVGLIAPSPLSSKGGTGTNG